MRKPEPDLAAAVTALARRVETLASRLADVDRIAADLDAVGHGLGALTAQVQTLTDATNRRILTTPTRGIRAAGTDAESGEAAAVDEAGDGQPNWLTVTDPDTAAQWLADAAAFAADVLPRFGSGALPGCWPLHPAAVAEVLALRAQHELAYSLPEPTGVSEVLARWLPGAKARIGKELYGCDAQRAHQCRGRAYEIPRLDPARVAGWWVDTRGSDPDEIDAFAMTRIR
jgi:hypothetical protein